MAQKLDQLQPFIAVFPPECTGQLVYFGTTYLIPFSLQYQPEMVGAAAGRHDSEMRLVARLVCNARTHMLDGRRDRTREALGVAFEVTAHNGARPSPVK